MFLISRENELFKFLYFLENQFEFHIFEHFLEFFSIRSQVLYKVGTTTLL